jgi:hypothetical protein
MNVRPILEIADEGDLNGVINTPADSSWNLGIYYMPVGSVTEQYTYVTYLSTGEISPSTPVENFVLAANLLGPSINLLQNLTGNAAFDGFEFMNWIFVTYYWIMLYDFGQTAPTYYEFTTLEAPNFMDPTYFTSDNNPFVNDKLFGMYSAYLNNTIIPLLQLQGIHFRVGEFLPLTNSNTLSPIPTTFLRSYSCSQRQAKGWVSLLMNVIIADYTFVFGAYHLLLMFIAWRKKVNPSGIGLFE